jgi:hypothetical protein
MSRIGDWFRRLGGRPAESPTPTPVRMTPAKQPANKPAPGSPAPPGQLSIEDAPPARPAAKTGAAGFDPYSSDAGYQKPHSWERVDHD